MAGGDDPGDLDAMREALADRAEEVARELLGEPNRAMSSRREARFGRRGSLKVTLKGRWAGRWRSFESGEKGDLFDLIRRETGGSFADAVAWARRFMGWPEPKGAPSIEERHPNSIIFGTGRHAPPADPEADATAKAVQEAERATRAAKRAEAEALDAAIQEGRRRRAEAVWNESEDAGWSLGERYLTKVRRIRGVAEFPACAIRFHARLRAVVAAATDDAGRLVGVQLILLDKAGRKRAGRRAKLSYGPVGRGVVRLPTRPDCRRPGVLLLAEGVETGLTVWAATGCETWVTLGPMARLTPPQGRLVVTCRDDDPAQSPAAKAMRHRLAKWRAAGLDVASVFPTPIRRGDRADFNDLAQRAGMTAVRKRIEDAIEVAQARFAVALPGVDEARLLVTDRVRAASAQRRTRLALTPTAWGVKAGVGLGKTRAVLSATVDLLTALRAIGDKSLVVVAVPQHRLSDEQVQRFAEESGGAFVARPWRGREALDPNGDGETMCRNVGRVREAQALVLDPAKVVCRAGCPHFSGCAYLGQRVEDADLLIIAHRGLFGALPEQLRGREVAFVVIDETSWHAGLIGVGDERLTLPLDALVSGAMPVPSGLPANEVNRLLTQRYTAAKNGNHDEVARIDEALAASRHRQDKGERLTALRHGLHAALLDNGIAALRRDALVRYSLFDVRDFGNEGLGPEACGLEMSRKIDGELGPEGGDAGEVELNRTIRAADWLWQAVGALLFDDPGAKSGWVELVAGPDGGRQIAIRGRRSVHEHFSVPTLLIDADLDEELASAYWPGLRLFPPVEAAAPHMRVRQAWGRSFGKRMLEPLSGEKARRKPEEAKLRAKNLRSVWRSVVRTHQVRGGRTLVVGNKTVVAALDALGLPAGVESTWFGALRGRDGWGDVATVIVIGRPAPPPREVENLAAALTGEAVERVGTPDGWFLTGDTPRLVTGADGLARISMAEGPAHLVGIVERMRRQIADAEVWQAIGRARGVNRTERGPVEVIVLSDVVLPVAVEEIDAEAVLKMRPVDMMLAEGGVAMSSPTDAARLYPKLWETTKAAEHAFKQKAFPHSPIDIYYGEKGESFHYQLHGNGQSFKSGVFDPVTVPDPRTWLESRLGPLAAFEIVERDDIPDAPASLPGGDAPPHGSAEHSPELSIDERPWPEYRDESIDNLSPNLSGRAVEQASEIEFLTPLKADWPPECDPDVHCTGANGRPHGPPIMLSEIMQNPSSGAAGEWFLIV